MSCLGLSLQIPAATSQVFEMLVQSIVPFREKYVSGLFREVYLKSNVSVTPTIATSRCVPHSLVTHLMRNKKDSAITVKYVDGDAITNMEGCLHSLVTPIAPILIQGDYCYHNGHRVPRFGPINGYQAARPVLLSALVQPDFEFANVMFRLVELEQHEVIGEPLPSHWEPASANQKADAAFRDEYDLKLKKHMVNFFMGRLPSLEAVTTLSECQVLDELRKGNSKTFLHTNNGTISIEFLAKIVRAQIDVEIRGLTEAAGPSGFVYTWDPPVIFARTVRATILDQLWAQSIVEVLETSRNSIIKVAFNDYCNTSIIPHLKSKGIEVVSKSSLFTGPKGTYKITDQLAEAALVIHNNGDGFGQNIETETEHQSLDGAIGACSNASAALHREKSNLLHKVLVF